MVCSPQGTKVRHPKTGEKPWRTLLKSPFLTIGTKTLRSPPIVPFSVCTADTFANKQALQAIEGGLYSMTALRETWATRRCILNTRNYHKQASTTSKAHFTRRSSSLSGSHSACQLPWLHPCAARVRPSGRWPQGQPGPRPDPARLSSARASRPWRA